MSLDKERLQQTAELAKLMREPRTVLGLIIERDQLKAENAGLKTGYEAYEQVVQGLKVEVEKLRKNAERANYWKQRAKSAEGHLFSGDFREAAMELHRYSRFESTPWPELTGSQQALVCGAAGAVIAVVNRRRDARRPKDHCEPDGIVWCACGDGHAANSYGAGFMDANGGVCANCDAANQGVEPDLEALRKDADRYRWLRSQHWNESDMAVVCHPKKSVKLGFDCPSGERLDHAIDAAMGKGELHD